MDSSYAIFLLDIDTTDLRKYFNTDNCGAAREYSSTPVHCRTDLLENFMSSGLASYLYPRIVEQLSDHITVFGNGFIIENQSIGLVRFYYSDSSDFRYNPI